MISRQLQVLKAPGQLQAGQGGWGLRFAYDRQALASKVNKAISGSIYRMIPMANLIPGAAQSGNPNAKETEGRR
jgi:hypothetical protein